MIDMTGLGDLDVVVKGREKSKILDRCFVLFRFGFGMSNRVQFVEVNKFQAVAGDGVGNLRFSFHHFRLKIIIKLPSEGAK